MLLLQEYRAALALALPEEEEEVEEGAGAQLSFLALLVQKHLLYWYKSTPYQRWASRSSGLRSSAAASLKVLNLLALLVQKYRY